MELELPRGCAAKYAVERRLAAGGFGTVYLARHRELDRPVALKLLNPASLDDPEAVDRFRNEARITASLTHAHIVVLLDHGVDDHVPWIAYEYLPATSLRTLVTAGPLGWREALSLAAQITSALAVAHGSGILHRDIKPENVLLVDDTTCKVADFGTAKWASGRVVNTGEGVILGTPAYLAPELISGAPATPQSDVYATGVMLYELLTGRVPFDADTVAASLRDRLEFEPLPPSARVPGLPPEVDRVVMKAVARSRTDRYMTAHAFHTALRALVEDEPAPSLAAYRRRAHATQAPAVTTFTVRTVVEPALRRRSTALVPALAVRGPGRAVLALSLATFFLGSVAVLTHAPAPRPFATPDAAAPDVLPQEGADYADTRIDALVQKLAGRRARAEEMWSRVLDIANEPTAAHQLARELAGEYQSDAKVTADLATRLESFASPTPVLAALNARLAALDFELWCRRDTCRIVLDAKHEPASPIDMLRSSQNATFGPEALPRLRSFLMRLTLAVELAARTPAGLDRRLAELVDDAWRCSRFVGHELLHLREPAIQTLLESTLANLTQRVKDSPGQPVLEILTPVLGAWKLTRAAERRDALQKAEAALQVPRKAAPWTAGFAATLAARLAARRLEER